MAASFNDSAIRLMLAYASASWRVSSADCFVRLRILFEMWMKLGTQSDSFLARRHRDIRKYG